MDAILTNKAEHLACEMAAQATTLDDLIGLMRAMMKSALAVPVGACHPN